MRLPQFGEILWYEAGQFNAAVQCVENSANRAHLMRGSDVVKVLDHYSLGDSIPRELDSLANNDYFVFRDTADEQPGHNDGWVMSRADLKRLDKNQANELLPSLVERLTTKLTSEQSQ